MFGCLLAGDWGKKPPGKNVWITTPAHRLGGTCFQEKVIDANIAFSGVAAGQLKKGVRPPRLVTRHLSLVTVLQAAVS
jgi:hypothetical protein